jgi:hypothetical protein
LENTEENCEMIWKIRKKSKSNSQNMDESENWIVNRFVKCGRKVGWIVKRYEKRGRKIGWIVKRKGQYGRNAIWIVRRY